MLNNLITLFILLGYYSAANFSTASVTTAAEALISLANEEATGIPVALQNNNSRRSRAKTVACQYCNHKTAYRSAIIIHERIHTGEKPYECQFCDYRAAQNSILKNHAQRHFNGCYSTQALHKTNRGSLE
jgi:uncharacterized Zn-finger protein